MLWFQAVVLSLAAPSGNSVVLDFSAEWCGACRQMDSTVHQLAQMQYPIQKVDLDRQRDLAAKYGVRAIPCFVLVIDGREVDRVVGPTSFSRLEQMCKRALAGRSRRPAPVELASTHSEAIQVPPARSVRPSVATPRKDLAALPEARSPGTTGAPTWRQVAADRAPRRGRASGSDAQLIASAVRLRIEDADGHSCGSGTIIDTRDGKALILTCGHIFRDSQGKGRIEVDLFGPNQGRRVVGNLIGYDLDRDLGLLWIRTPGPVPAIRVAPRAHRLSPGDLVTSVGCNNGAPPTIEWSRITSLDKYQGAPNLQVAGPPAVGRSGGGLFSSDGMLVGVCNAADPKDREGLYAALASIHAELGQFGLSQVAQAADGTRQGKAPLVAVNPPSMPKRMPLAGEPTPPVGIRSPLSAVRPTSGHSSQGGQLSVDERAALEEIRRRQAEGAEVICIVRTRSDRPTKTEIVTLEAFSPASRRLTGDNTRRQNIRQNLLQMQSPGEEAEVVCVIRSQSDSRGKSEILLLERVSTRFLECLTGYARPRHLRPTSLDVAHVQRPSGRSAMLEPIAAPPRPGPADQ